MEETTDSMARLRLSSIRKNHDLCDAWVKVDEQKIPVHVAVLADISPVFKNAFCGDFKEGQDKMIVFKDSSAKVMNIVLDFAYGIVSADLSSDMELCLAVWKEAHMYAINGLREEVSRIALRTASAKHRCQILQHAMLYGTAIDQDVASDDFAEDIVQTSRECSEFGEVSGLQLLCTLSNENIVASENEKLEVITTWIEQNGTAPTYVVEELYARIRLERLYDLEKIQELCGAGDCPRFLLVTVSAVYFHRLKDDIAWRRRDEPLTLARGHVRIFVNSHSGVEKWKYFSFRNLAMAVCVSSENVFSLKCEHREKKSATCNSFTEQVTSGSFNIRIDRASGSHSYVIKFEAKPVLAHWISKPIHPRTGQEEDGNFWLAFSQEPQKSPVRTGKRPFRRQLLI